MELSDLLLVLCLQCTFLTLIIYCRSPTISRISVLKQINQPVFSAAPSNPTSQIDVSNPLYLHPSDHQVMVLVSRVFTGEGFEKWKHSFMEALAAKNKLGFIDGTCTKPDPGSPLHPQWGRCNDMVISWLLNALHREIADSFSSYKDAKDIWKKLTERFGLLSEAELHQGRRDSGLSVQGDSDLPTNFTRAKRHAQVRAHTQIVAKDASFYARNNKLNAQKRRFDCRRAHLFCAYCKKQGHRMDTCFKLYGCPYCNKNMNRNFRVIPNNQVADTGIRLGAQEPALMIPELTQRQLISLSNNVKWQQQQKSREISSACMPAGVLSSTRLFPLMTTLVSTPHQISKHALCSESRQLIQGID